MGGRRSQETPDLEELGSTWLQDGGSGPRMCLPRGVEDKPHGHTARETQLSLQHRGDGCWRGWSCSQASAHSGHPGSLCAW